MDVFYAYTYSTATWLGLQAVTLIAIPTLVISMLASEVHQATDMEIYFTRSLGISLAVLALIVLFFTGTIPLSSSISEPVSLEDNDPKAPYALPILRITALFHSAQAIYCYMRYVNYQQSGYLVGAFGYGVMACIGLWCVVFGMDSGHKSKRTGKDKRASGFPFKNSAAYNPKIDKKMG